MQYRWRNRWSHLLWSLGRATLALWVGLFYSATTSVASAEVSEAAVAEKMGSPDWVDREFGARLALKHHMTGQKPKVVDLLDDTNPNVRASALEATGGLGFREGIPQAIRLLDDDMASVRLAAIRALAQLRAEEAAPALIGRLKDGEDSVVEEAIRGLGTLGASEAGEAIAPLLRDPDPAIRRAACATLAALKYVEAATDISRLLSDDRMDIQSTALHALLAMRRRPPVSVMRSLIVSDHASLRLQAVMAVLDMQYAELIPDLIKRIEDTEVVVAMQAIYALGRLGAQAASERLTEVAFSENQDTLKRAAAIVALGQLEAADSLEKVKQLTSSADVHLRRAAIKALGSFHDADSETVLARILKEDPDLVCRWAAEVALATRGKKQPEDVAARIRSEIESLGKGDERETLREMIVLLTDLPADVSGPALEVLAASADEETAMMSRLVLRRVYYDHLPASEFVQLEEPWRVQAWYLLAGVLLVAGLVIIARRLIREGKKWGHS